MTEKLLPCPFCEGEASYRDDEQYLNVYDDVGNIIDVDIQEACVFIVECECGASTMSDESKEQAITAWNRRSDAVPVVRGEWVVTDAYPHRVYCSLCYKTNVPNEEWLYEKNDYPKYCMWCGAKMESEA